MAGFINLFAFGQRLADLLNRFFIQHDLALEHTVEIVAIHHIDISRVRPLQAPHAGNTPSWEWRFSKHIEEGRRVARNHLPRLFQASAG